MLYLKRVLNVVVAIHHNGLGISYLATRTPLLYPVGVVIAAPLVTAMFFLDPDEFDQGD